jgi:hypothetical protein
MRQTRSVRLDDPDDLEEAVGGHSQHRRGRPEGKDPVPQ